MHFLVRIQIIFFIYTLYLLQFSFCIFPSFALKIYKDASFSSDSRIVKITAILQFSCPCARILTFFYPVVCIVLDVNRFRYIKISFVLPSHTIHRYFCVLILYYKKEIFVSYLNNILEDFCATWVFSKFKKMLMYNKILQLLKYTPWFFLISFIHISDQKWFYYKITAYPRALLYNIKSRISSLFWGFLLIYLYTM